MMTVVEGEEVRAVLVKMLHQPLELCRVDVPRNQLQKDEVPVACSFGHKSDLGIKGLDLRKFSELRRDSPHDSPRRSS